MTLWPNCPEDWGVLWVLICTVHLAVCYYHVTYAFQSEFTLYVFLNVKKLLVRNRCKIWSLNDSNGTWTHNHLVREQTLNPLAKLSRRLRCVVSTYFVLCISSERNTQPFGETDQKIELFCEYLSVPCIWLYVIIMSCTHFRMNPHSMFPWMSRNSLLETGAISEV